MIVNKYRGHKIEEKNKGWVFSGTRKLVRTMKNIKCGYCNQSLTKDGHDNCLGKLPGLMNACCGHGDIDEMYIQFLDGVCINGKEAFIIIEKLKKSVVNARKR